MCGEVKLYLSGEKANPNGNPSLVCKKLFFPQENFNENGYRFMGYSTFVPLQFNSSYFHRYSMWVFFIKLEH